MSRPVCISVLALACLAFLPTCGGDDDATAPPTIATPTTPPESSSPDTTTAAAATRPADSTTSTSAPGTSSVPATDVTLPAEPVDVDDVSFIDPAIGDPAEAACRAFGTVAEGPDTMLAALAPDAVIVDAIEGTTHAGIEGISAYADAMAADGVDNAICIHRVQSDRWVGASISLSYDNYDVRTGVLAIHVRDDGTVDRAVTHFSDRTETATERADPGLGATSVAVQLCEAWMARDADTVLSLMSEEPIVHTQRDFVGREAVARLVTDLPYDIHTCGVEAQISEWETLESIMTDPETGAERSMLSVLALGDDGRVEQHWFYFDA